MIVNAVLNTIPIFYLSYLKMPSIVWNEVVKIQRKFLLSGLSYRRRISWMKWDEVCKPKREGGLRVCDLRLTNISLLAKRRWKLLEPEREFWKDIIVSKYGVQAVGRNSLWEEDISRLRSVWWRNICLLDKEVRMFEEGVYKTMGNGNSTSFWHDVWVGNQALSSRFPRLFSISQHQLSVSQNGAVGINWLAV